jgi:hypothetical protein
MHSNLISLAARRAICERVPEKKTLFPVALRNFLTPNAMISLIVRAAVV